MNYPNLSGNVPKNHVMEFLFHRWYDANINSHIDSFKIDVMVMVDKLIVSHRLSVWSHEFEYLEYIKLNRT